MFLLSLIILMFLTIIPVKIGAELFNVPNKEMGPCVLAAVVATILTAISFYLFNGLLAALIVLITVSITYSKILQISYSGGFGFTIAMFFIQSGITKLLAGLGSFFIPLVFF